MLCKYGCGNEGKFQLRNGEWMCEDSFNKCPINREKNSNGKRSIIERSICKYCEKEVVTYQIKRHENSCYLNPKNIKLCVRCNKPIKTYKTSKTCSNTCANKTFKQLGKNHWNYHGIEDNHYRTICFKYHDHKCIICDEDLMLDVHHYDNNPKNNDPKNLIPICATHHRYLHSNNKYILKECIDEYVENFIKNGALV